MSKKLTAALAAGLVATAFVACEPSSVTEAREQLARNAEGILEFHLPVADTTYFVAELIGEEDTVTTPDGLLGVRIQSDSIEAVTYDQFLIAEQMTTSITISAFGLSFAPGDQRDTLPLETPQGSDVTGGVVRAGNILRTITNNSGCSGIVADSIFDGAGNLVVGFPAVTINDGQVVNSSVSAAGRVVVGFLEIRTGATILGGCFPTPGSSVSAGFTVGPLDLASVSLDNVSETVAVEQFQEVDANDVDFDDLEEAIDQSTLNSALIDLTVENSAGLPIVIDNFTLGAVRLDAVGQLVRDGLGNLQFEESSPGSPILISVSDPGQTTLSLARQSTINLSVNAASLVDRVVDLILNDVRVAIVASGTAVGGDGGPSTLTDQDYVRVLYDFTVGLDFTIPPGGVAFTRNQTLDGLSIDPDDQNDFADRILTAAVSAAAGNSTPFGVEIDIAIAPDSLGDGDDVFAHPDAVLLDRVTLGAPVVDAAGISTGTVSDSVSLAISGSEATVAMGDIFTAGIRVRLVPGSGANGRGAVRPSDGVAIDASLELQIRRGNQ